jgi:TonB-linked SusC/RagA family outer membrane protein
MPTDPRLRRSVVRAALVLGLLPAVALAQQGTIIAGRVTSKQGGVPLPIATVSIPTLRVGSITNSDGNYRFTVPASATGTVTLLVRRIGYVTDSARITLSGGTVRQDFTLVVQAMELAQVVVTGLGVEREKARLGTAQQQVTAGDVNETRALNFAQQLQGKVSGVQITSSGTQGGSTNIIIRGQNSILGNNQPLFIVDGIAVSNANRGGDRGSGFDFGNVLSDLNPDEIESLSVLKGPNAAAIYGSRAANGVILITTRKGRNTAGRMRTEVNTVLTWEKPSILPKWQNQYGQGAGGEFAWADGSGGGVNDGADQSWGPKLDGRLICQFTSPGAGTSNCTPTPWVAHPDNMEAFFRTGLTAATTAAVSGGTDRASGRLSLGADNINGIFPNNAFQRRTVALSGTFVANARLTADGSVQYVRNTGMNRPGTGYWGRNPLENYIWFGRQVDIHALHDYTDKNGATNGGPATREFNWNYNYHNNPFWLQDQNPVTDARDRLIGNVTARYHFNDHLSASLRTGSDIYRLGIEEDFAQGGLSFVNAAYAGGFVFINDYRNDNNTDLTITGDRQLTSWLQVNVVGGGNLRREYFNTNSQQTAGLVVPGIYNPSNAAITPTIAQTIQRRQVNSVYGSAAFTMYGWWTVEGTARNDWASTLPVSQLSYFYPSVNTSVILTDALPSLRSSVVSGIKLRAAVARVGSDAPVYSLAPVFIGDANKFASQPQFRLDNSLANANLKPEITRSDEVGAELSLFRNRVTLDGSYYNKATRNQIFNVQISPASGFTSKWINAGEISNRGLEGLLTMNLLDNPRSLTWSTTLSYAHNRSKVVDLSPGVTTIVLGNGLFGDVTIEARKGEAYGTIRGNPFERDSAGNILTDGGVPIGGAFAVLGNIQPNWTGGWANQFSFRNFSVNALLDVRQGGQIVSLTNYLGDYAGTLASSLHGREQDWDKPGIVVKGVDVNTGQPNTENITAETYYQSLFHLIEPYIYDGSYVKLRELRVSYNLPSSWAGRFLGARTASIALTGRNLMTWKKVPNVDPEFTYSSGNNQGMEYMIPSNPRSIGVNVRIIP